MSFSFISKNVASFTQAVKHVLSGGFLLKEDGFYLLLEDGGKIELEDSDFYNYDTKHTS